MLINRDHTEARCSSIVPGAGTRKARRRKATPRRTVGHGGFRCQVSGYRVRRQSLWSGNSELRSAMKMGTCRHNMKYLPPVERFSASSCFPKPRSCNHSCQAVWHRSRLHSAYLRVGLPESFMHACIHSFIPSFLPSLLPSFLRSFVRHPFIHSFCLSFIHSCIGSFNHSFIRSFNHSFIH